MNLFYNEFPIPSKLDWEAVLRKELKGQEPSEALNYTDEIDELNVSSYLLETDVNLTNIQPNQYPFTRGNKIENNDWSNALLVQVNNEVDANKIALDYLMKGAESIIFDVQTPELNSELLLQGIGLEFISVHFIIKSKSVLNSLLKTSLFNSYFRIDFSEIDFSEIADQLIEKNIPFCFVDAYQVQKVGGNIHQELGYALSLGHDYLVDLLAKGLSVEKASKLIHFNFGVGSRYFNEITKLRVFRKLWSFILKQYNAAPLEVFPSFIAAEIGFLNKSLKDPYSNLLRQTTEVMSAAIGGVNMLLVNPYDRYSKNGSSEFTQRMALNISLILKEESYFDKVIDTVGGSYLVEKLTEQVSDKAWTYFQELDANGGVLNSLNSQQLLKENIVVITQKRVQKINSKESVLIGINKYLNPNEEKLGWSEIPGFMGLEALVLERKVVANEN